MMRRIRVTTIYHWAAHECQRQYNGDVRIKTTSIFNMLVHRYRIPLVRLCHARTADTILCYAAIPNRSIARPSKIVQTQYKRRLVENGARVV